MVKDLGLASPLQDTLLQLTGIYNLWFSKTSRKTWSTKVMFAEDFPSYHALSGAPGSALGCKFQPSGSIGREVFKSAHPRGFPRSCLHWPRQEILLRKSRDKQPPRRGTFCHSGHVQARTSVGFTPGWWTHYHSEWKNPTASTDRDLLLPEGNWHTSSASFNYNWPFCMHSHAEELNCSLPIWSTYSFSKLK